MLLAFASNTLAATLGLFGLPDKMTISVPREMLAVHKSPPSRPPMTMTPECWGQWRFNYCQIDEMEFIMACKMENYSPEERIICDEWKKWKGEERKLCIKSFCQFLSLEIYQNLHNVIKSRLGFNYQDHMNLQKSRGLLL